MRFDIKRSKIIWDIKFDNDLDYHNSPVNLGQLISN